MGGTWSDMQCRCGAAVLLIVGAMLAGCSGGSSGGESPSFLPSLPGSFASYFASTAPAQAPTAAGAPRPAVVENCPTIEIRSGASTLPVAAKTEQATAQDLRYQLTFTETARQCTILGTSMRMRVGVQGRVIAGPAGAPSQVEVPVRYAVVREGVEPKTITTKLRRFQVPVAPGAPNVVFTDIEEDLSFPMPSTVDLDAYVVYVGFDAASGRTERQPPAKKSAPSAR
jgi:hypothetical protein